MSSFLASRGVLFTAWGAVLLVLGGGLTLALLQPPPPPPGAEPVTLAVAAAPPTAGATEAAETPDPTESAPDQGATAAPLDQVTVGIAAKPPAASDPPVDEKAAKAKAADEKAAEEITGETAAETLPAAEPAAEAAPAREEAPVDKVVAALPPPTAKPVAVPAEKAAQGDAAAGAAAAPAAAGEAATEADEEQLVAIPLIPPAPEELAYWERYRQPFNMEDPRPRIAVVLAGLGLSDSATEAAINRLPSSVTLSFSPYARNLERWIALARARGHEVMLDLPMEPATFPNEDPGPQGLLTGLSAEDNLDRLDWVLSRGSAYVGLAGSMGSRFTASRQAMEPVLRDVKKRGLIFLDRRTTEHSVVAELAGEIGLPTAINNRAVDERQASRVAIDARLAQIERIALTDGFAVAMAQPYPVTLDRLAEWATELTARGFVIAPISALVDRQQRP